jgi:hypothetical protein
VGGADCSAGPGNDFASMARSTPRVEADEGRARRPAGWRGRCLQLPRRSLLVVGGELDPGGRKRALYRLRLSPARPATLLFPGRAGKQITSAARRRGGGRAIAAQARRASPLWRRLEF